MLDPNALKQQAVDQTGLDNFGDEPLNDGLIAFCESLRLESCLPQPRLKQAEASIVATLSERLRIEACLQQNPSILDEQIISPIFVVGLPRSGTTALSQLLSEDPQMRSIRRWESTQVTPPPDVSVKHDPRIEDTTRAFAARDAALPALKTMLAVEPADPSEHGIQLGLTFRNLQLPSLWPTPSYTQWLQAADMRPAYAYFAKVLKILQWKTPAPCWNLKNPPDIFSLDAIAAVFPDARFVWAHRDPLLSIPSVCSLVSTIREASGEAVNKAALGRMQLDFQSAGVKSAMQARDQLSDRIFADVYQKDLDEDPIRTLQVLYDAVGREFTDDYKSRLHSRLKSRPKGKHGAHTYTREEFGLDAPELRSAFKDYIDRFH
tara:strand:- start:31 stop:1161 length:1131 start_codon:yes stop_codon:yes gene_type:complete